MLSVPHSRRAFRFQGRSFLAFVLTPDGPIQDWLAALDTWCIDTPDFLTQRPVVLDLSRIVLTKPETAGLLAQLQTRRIRLISVEGVDQSWLGAGLGPLLGGKTPGQMGAVDVKHQVESPEIASSQTKPEENALLLNTPVRSGQSIFFPRGDITITGSVASGAEIVAGGSIHVYGTLRGRAFAGSEGSKEARIFCSKFQAELLVIGGIYKAAEDIDSDLHGRAIQAWCEGSAMMVTALE